MSIGHMEEDWGSMDPQAFCTLLTLPISSEELLHLGDQITEESDEALIQHLLKEHIEKDDDSND